MRTIPLKLAAVFVSTGLLGLIGGMLVGVAQMPTPQPKGEPPAKVEGPPAPKRPSFDLPEFHRGAWMAITEKGAFPEIKPPVPRERGAAPEEAPYPHIFGLKGIPDEPTDDTYRRLLKASLHTKTQFHFRLRSRVEVGQFASSDYFALLLTMDEMRDLVVELWATNPKLLVPWLEELLKLAKETERFTFARVQIGQDLPQTLDLAISHRLKAEAALWKAKNPKPVGR